MTLRTLSLSSRDDFVGEPNRPIKEILGYPLVKDFRERLTRAEAH